ncbi:RDD family protein [Streptomyces sp. NPDC093510]|uniref:RDD family protein n=1 Tax=Streptomyces sp. NPDC093510 TaxID=3155199 RepID=UPI0034420FA9
MDKRQAMGSWLSGPRAAAEDAGVDFGYRGQQLGLPEEGPGAIARPGRRIGAIAVDWGLSMLIAYGLFARGDQQAMGNWALGIFFLMSLLTVATVGCTPGKVLFRLRVIAENGGRLAPGWALVRSVLLCLVVPALIWDRDGRGLHDRLSRSIQIRI